MKDNIIVIDHLSCTLDGKEILKDISLTISRGEYFSIVGPNGSGKTTLLKSMVRIIKTTKGRVAIAGKEIGAYGRKEIARLIAYVPQADGRSSPFSVEEFVMMARYPYLSPFSASRKEDEDAVMAALETTETSHLAGRLLAGLSGGERQKVFIAAALAQNAPVMLLDEPTTFLDPKHVTDILDLLERINKDRGVTIVSVTHDINAAAFSSGRIAALREGSLIFCGDSRVFMNEKTLKDIYGIGFYLIDHPGTGGKFVVPGGKR